MNISKTVLLGITILINQFTFAQADKNSELYKELYKADSLVFEEGFNRCNFTVLEKIIHSDFEFLHDQNGIQNREEFFKVFKESICPDTNLKPIRKLIEESLEVYPLKNEGKIYGAIQIGFHEFFIAEPDKELSFTSNGKFIHTWILENEQWKLKHVVSYDHQQQKE